MPVRGPICLQAKSCHLHAQVSSDAAAPQGNCHSWLGRAVPTAACMEIQHLGEPLSTKQTSVGHKPLLKARRATSVHMKFSLLGFCLQQQLLLLILLTRSKGQASIGESQGFNNGLCSRPTLQGLTPLYGPTFEHVRSYRTLGEALSSLQVRRNVTGSYLEGLSGEHSQLEAALEASQVHDLMAAYLVVLSSALYDSGCGHTQSPALL